ncbi:MAG: NAD-dependent epimerase/dehydratase family protein [Bradyrhizobium sp.]|uniref:hopanoid-associated sugar epimerase n=1 Tax=Bradyrhizobium sp. TaxID=376 RepID=UPI001C29F765|nr:hopanoid-associated sugar epimerase [Bradyrhizobium sp.]MBU6462570.1 NAD-dependent epimerase/dehydratase family protein [Pseudomonadota bacterium]MDE2067191.1 NAD-dependent epimerase/dehydratase family protein [Bradyrhizobium sp.]MDE2468350.1 NAD-dependent epimerase/dehydratase family protein [Bradyrhizobium sp.]
MRPADVLITGASGFVGSAVLRQLYRAGFAVRALVRRDSVRSNLAATDLQLVEGDLRDIASLEMACSGCRYVFHVAAEYRLSSWDKARILATNVTGTRNLMESALRAGVERIVYTSSVATLGVRHDGTPADESNSISPQQTTGPYKRSKVLAEQVVLDMINQRGLPAVIVNPSTPVGPRDIRPTPTGKIIIAAASARLPAYVNTGLNLVHVDDVGLGHLAALRRGRIGERYILGGQNVLFSQMLAEIAELVGRTAPRIRIPWPFALPLAAVGEARAYLTGEEPLATWAGVLLSRHKMFFSSAKAERELGFTSRPHAAALCDAVAWFSEHGYLSASRAVSLFGTDRSAFQ